MSSPGCGEVVNSADAILAAGPLFNDYTTVGWTAQPSADKLIQVDPDRVCVGGMTFNDVYLVEFLDALAAAVKRNPATLLEFRRSKTEPAKPSVAQPDAPLTRAEICHQSSRGDRFKYHPARRDRRFVV